MVRLLLLPYMHVLVADELVSSGTIVVVWSRGKATVGHSELQFGVPDVTGHINPAVDWVSYGHHHWEGQSIG